MERKVDIVFFIKLTVRLVLVMVKDFEDLERIIERVKILLELFN